MIENNLIMRVLIVNAYHSSEEGQKSFFNFQQAIQKCFTSQKCFSKDEIKFESVDFKTIDKYLYEQNTVYLDPQAEKKFDYLDFIFIDGEPNMLPWYEKSQKLLILLKMCKRTKKVLFAAGCGMLMHVYLCSNKYHINKVINGNGKGTSLNRIFSMKVEELGQIQSGDVFLDSGTGDMYCYDNITSEFFPIVNIGLQDFLIPQKNSWDVHPVNVSDINSHFTILAESDRGPQIILQQNTVGTLFNIDATYANTIKILNNFIEHFLKLYQEKPKLDLPLSSVPYTVMTCKPFINHNFINSSRPITASTTKLETSVYPGENNPKKLRPTSSHSGFTISKRRYQPIIVENNATRQGGIQVAQPMLIKPTDSESLLKTNQAPLKIKGSFDKLSSVFNLRQQFGLATTSIADSALKPSPSLDFNEFFKTKTIISENSKINSNKIQQNRYQSELTRILNCEEVIEETNDIVTWNKNDIRNMLHGNDFAASQPLLKKPKIRIVHNSKYKKRKPIKEENFHSTLNQKNKHLKYPFPGSVTSIEPYVDPYKISIRPDVKSNNWITKEGFSLNNKKIENKTEPVMIQEATNDGIKNEDPYNPPSAHKFRDENKNKWIQGCFKLL